MRTKTKGLLLAFLAYVLWGILSLYWKQLGSIPAYDIFAYRILWTVLTMLVYMVLFKQHQRFKRELQTLWQSKMTLVRMMLASLFITINWLFFIWSVTHGQATQASLGYYVMPLASIVLSLVFLKETLTNAAKLAILLAFLGVSVLIYQTGSLPLITLLLAVTFALYGLIKKGISLSSDVAMLFEASFILPVGLVYLFLFSKVRLFELSFFENILLMLSGIITAIPLLLFAEGVKRAPLNQVGFIQYVNPTIQLLIAVTVFGESMTRAELGGFSLIWLAVLVFIVGQIMTIKASKKE